MPDASNSQGIRDRLWINGGWEDADSGETFPTENPATEEVIAHVAAGAAADVARAVRSAREAFEAESWRRMSAHKRSRLLWNLADLIAANADELAGLETQDNGKPYFESRKVDLPSVVENFRYFAGLADKIQGSVVPVDKPDHFTYILKEPVGVGGGLRHEDVYLGEEGGE